MDKLVLGVAAFALSAGAASAQVVYPGYGYAPLARLRTLWLRLHSYGSSLRLCRSSLGGTGPRGTAWVRATDLHTTTLRTNSCLPSAASGARLLHSAVSGGFAAVI